MSDSRAQRKQNAHSLIISMSIIIDGESIQQMRAKEVEHQKTLLAFSG